MVEGVLVPRRHRFHIRDGRDRGKPGAGLAKEMDRLHRSAGASSGSIRCCARGLRASLSRISIHGDPDVGCFHNTSRILE